MGGGLSLYLFSEAFMGKRSTESQICFKVFQQTKIEVERANMVRFYPLGKGGGYPWEFIIPSLCLCGCLTISTVKFTNNADNKSPKDFHNIVNENSKCQRLFSQTIIYVKIHSLNTGVPTLGKEGPSLLLE